VRPATRGLTRYPLALAVRRSDPAVQGSGELYVYEGTPRAHEVGELLILFLEEGVVKDLHLYAGLAQELHAVATHPGVGVEMSGHDPSYTGPQNSVRTGGRLAVVIAGLERYVQFGTSCARTGTPQGRDLCVIATGAGMPSFTDYRAVPHHDRPDEGVGRRSVASVLREFAGASHENVPNHDFLSPIRTLTVGAGLRPLPEHTLRPPSPAQPPGLSEGSRAARGT